VYSVARFSEGSAAATPHVTSGPFARIVYTVDELDFTRLYHRHVRDVHRFAWYLSGSATTADEVTAETFARAWVARGRIRVGSVKAFLLTIARNLCRDEARRSTPLQLPDDADVAETAAGPQRSAEARSDLQRVRRALAELPELDRAVLLMATMDGLSHQAIAEAVGLSTAAVKVRIHRARLRLAAARDASEVLP